MPQGEAVRTIPQSLYEFWVVASRPIANNGLGLSIAECEQSINRIAAIFPPLSDPPGLFEEWLKLVVIHSCFGKVAHDARYVAALRIHGLTRILTFNAADLARFSGISVIDPATVKPPPSP